MAYTWKETEIDPGAYDIDFLKITGDGGEVDITYMFIELNINENIFAKCITGSILIQDSLNLITNFPIREGDLLIGRLKTIDTDPFVRLFDPLGEIDFTFEIVKITHQEKVKQDAQVFGLSFVSSTWSDNLSNRVSKAWKMFPYSLIVEEIYYEYLVKGGLYGLLPPKPLTTIPTEMLFNVVIPNWKPYDAITWLSRRSFLGAGVNYLFFEDRDMFHYEPFDLILAKPPVETYFTSSADRMVMDGLSDEPNPEYLRPRYLNISTMKWVGYHDVSKASTHGMLGNRMIRWDPFYKRVVDFFPRGPIAPNYTLDLPYNYDEEFFKLNHCEKTTPLIRPEVSTKFGLDDSNTVLSVVPDHNWCWDDQPMFMTERFVRQRKGQIEQLQFVEIEVTTPGNFTRTVGEKIELDLNSPEWKPKGDDEEPIPDTRFSGNWLIVQLRRKFTSDRHTCVMTLIKDNYLGLVTNPIWEAPMPPDTLKFDGHGNVSGL